MDYEKAYKAVLKTATQWIQDGCTDKEKICLESVFPELRESEDERTRKAIIELLKEMGRDDTGESENVKCMIAYLEKQKESLHIPETCKENTDSFTGGIIEVRSFQRGIEEGRRREKQKEQTSDIILKAFENSKTDYSLEEREEAIDYSEKVLPTSIAFGESDEGYLLHKVIEAAYIAGQKEQKPPIAGNDFGWIDELKHDLKHPEELDQKVDDVLKQRKGIRALEWSEEDERKRQACISTINEVIDYERERWEDYNPGKPYRPIMKYDEQIDWLKSLRPSWKPSEEQMEALNALNCHGDLSYVGQQGHLISLYNDLKKLM